MLIASDYHASLVFWVMALIPFLFGIVMVQMGKLLRLSVRSVIPLEMLIIMSITMKDKA